MKVSLNWVKEYTDVKLSVDELVTKIGAQLGAVEEVVDLGKKYQGILIVKVMSIEAHPNADKLVICKIDDGRVIKKLDRDKNGYVQLVSKAVNDHGEKNFQVNSFVAWAPPGSVVPCTHDSPDPVTMETRDMRGVPSPGMLLSGYEAAINSDHSGVAELDGDKLKPGADFAEIYGLNDHIIDIENKMFTHRPDLFGILGVAREIAGIQHQAFESPGWYLNPSIKFQGSSANDLPLKVFNDAPELAPRAMAVVIDNIKVGPSPAWMQATLTRVGIRSINNIVDVTNYMMHLTAQPMHAFDYHKIKDHSGGVPTIGPRLAREGEDLTLLGNKKIKLTESDIVIATDKQAVDLAGVMGGADTEVDQDTAAVVLTVCSFDMYAIRRSMMRHGVFTDAATRYTKNQSSLQNDRVLAKAMEMIHKYSGSHQASEVFDIKDDTRSPIAVHVTNEFINARLGIDLDIKKMARFLENVEFRVAINGPTLAVTPPFWRTDIEIPEDIVEEVGRLYGFDHLPLDLPRRDLLPVRQDPLIALKAEIRDILATAGANEVLNYSFVHGNLFNKVGQDKAQAFQLSNALSPDLQYYRLSLTPSLLDKVHPNIKAGHEEFALFELGKVHIKDETDSDNLPLEFNRLAFVFAAGPKAANSYAGAPFYQAKKYFVHLMESLGLDNFKLIHNARISGSTRASQSTHAPYDPDRTWAIGIDRGNKRYESVGVVGEFKTDVSKNLKLPAFSVGFELDLDIIMAWKDGQAASRYRPLPKFPNVTQDISLKVLAELSYRELFEFMRKKVDELKPRETTFSLEPLDIYQKDTDKRHKQIALRLSISSYERTLTDQEVNSLLDEAAQAAHKRFAAQRI